MFDLSTHPAGEPVKPVFGLDGADPAVQRQERDGGRSRRADGRGADRRDEDVDQGEAGEHEHEVVGQRSGTGGRDHAEHEQ